MHCTFLIIMIGMVTFWFLPHLKSRIFFRSDKLNLCLEKIAQPLISLFFSVMKLEKNSNRALNTGSIIFSLLFCLL